MKPISYPPTDEWNYSLKHRNGHTWLDADPCPECGSGIINAQIYSGVQFISASDRSRDEYGDTAENTDLFQADDGPWLEGLKFARCGECGNVLHDE